MGISKQMSTNILSRTSGVIPDKFWIKDDTSISAISGGYDTIMQNMLSTPTIDTIQGKMLTASLEFSSYEAEVTHDLEMKTKLLQLLLREILDNKCVEFTKQKNYAEDTVTIRARIFVTPDCEVKIIRQIQK